MQHRGEHLTPSNLSVELIIPSYNRIPILQETVKKVRTLYPELALCLGIQGEMPGPAFSEFLRRDGRVRLEAMSAPSTTKTLNHCIRTSRADVILILDDDAVPFFGWAEAHLGAFEREHGLAYTSGRELRFSKGRRAFSDWIRILAEVFYGMFLGSGKKINGRIAGWISWWGLIFANFDLPGTALINAPRGCNMAVRREIFLDSRGFNENFRGNAWGFEAEFGLRMARMRKYGQYRGDAIVIHYEVPSGGSRQASKAAWFRDFLFNHALVLHVLGPQGWIGSLPRLLKKLLR